MEQKLFAFWRYDLAPWVLGGEVTKMDDEGRVQIKEYGGGSFNPIKIVPLKAGQKQMERLEKLRSDYQRAIDAIEKQYRKEAEEIIGLKLF